MTESISLLGRAKLRQEAKYAKQKAEKLGILHSIGTAIASSLAEEQVLTRIVEAAVFITHAEEASLLLLDESTEELYLRAQKGLGEKYARGFRIRTEDSIAGDVVRAASPQRLVSEDKNLKVVTGYMVKSIVYVPVVTRRKVIGVLSADNQIDDRSFTEDDEELLSILAGYAAIAIENAKLLEELDQRAHLLADLYGIDHLEPIRKIDPKAVGIVLYAGPERPPSELSMPARLTAIVSPYLNAITEIQHIIDEIEEKPHSRVRVLAITQELPTIATIEGVRKAVEGISEIVVPWKHDLAQSMAQLVVKEKEEAVERAEAEVLKARAVLAGDELERDKMLAEAAQRSIAVEGFRWETERLRRKLHEQKIQLALDFVAQVKPELPLKETITYVTRLLPALDCILSSPLQISTMQERRGTEYSLEPAAQSGVALEHQGAQ